MIEILIYIYFTINLFIAGMQFKENYGFESNLYTFSMLILCLLFSTFAVIIYYLFYLLLPIIGWIAIEVKFNYRFYFTKHFDDIFLDDSYSEDYPTAVEKLKRAEELSNKGTKQFKRHNKIIQEKYAAN